MTSTRRHLVFLSILLLIFPIWQIPAYGTTKPKTVLRLNYTTISNPVVNTSSGPVSVEFTAFFNLESGQIAEGDLTCSRGPQAIINKLSDGSYSATCSMSFDASVPPGVQVVFIYSYGAPNKDVKIIPANASMTYTKKEQDSFGQSVINSYYSYELWDLKSAYYTAAPIVINPPSNFKLPNFPVESGAYVIFDVRKNATSPLVVKLDNTRKTFSVRCPTPKVPKELIPFIDPIGKYLISDQGTLRSFSGDESKIRFRYFDDKDFTWGLVDFRGKKVNLSCLSIVRMKKGSVYSGIMLTYGESSPKLVNFPRK